MAYANRKNSADTELWNVSLLPTITAAPSATPPQGPAPLGGAALQRPALLSVADGCATPPLARAA
jgi:hypothetical protein